MRPQVMRAKGRGRKRLGACGMPLRRGCGRLARHLLTKLNMKSVFKISLTEILEGVPGRIESIDASATDLERMEVMGLCVGRTVEVVQAGDPMIVRVLGTRIGLAAVLARSVRVTTERGD